MEVFIATLTVGPSTYGDIHNVCRLYFCLHQHRQGKCVAHSSRYAKIFDMIDMISICCFGGSFERLDFNMIVPSTRCYTITSSSALWMSLDDLNSLQRHAFIERWKVRGLQFAGTKPDVLLVGPQRIPKSVTTVRRLGEEKWEGRKQDKLAEVHYVALCHAFFVPGHELVILFDAHNQCTWSNALLCYSAELTLCLVSHVLTKGPKVPAKIRSDTCYMHPLQNTLTW